MCIADSTLDSHAGSVRRKWITIPIEGERSVLGQLSDEIRQNSLVQCNPHSWLFKARAGKRFAIGNGKDSLQVLKLLLTSLQLRANGCRPEQPRYRPCASLYPAENDARMRRDLVRFADAHTSIAPTQPGFLRERMGREPATRPTNRTWVLSQRSCNVTMPRRHAEAVIG